MLIFIHISKSSVLHSQFSTTPGQHQVNQFAIAYCFSGSHCWLQTDAPAQRDATSSAVNDAHDLHSLPTTTLHASQHLSTPRLFSYTVHWQHFLSFLYNTHGVSQHCLYHITSQPIVLVHQYIIQLQELQLQHTQSAQYIFHQEHWSEYNENVYHKKLKRKTSSHQIIFFITKKSK